MKPFVITSLLTIQQLNRHWQRHFPFLRLRIYSSLGRSLQGVQHTMPLHEISRQVTDTRWVVVEPTMTVRAFEKLFQSKFGLRVEVLRKSGYAWDETEYTNHWTLSEQNLKGKELSAVYRSVNKRTR